MDLLLILTYTALCIVIFKVFKIPLTKWTVPTAALGGVILIGTLVLAFGSNLWGLEAFTGINQVNRFLFACFLPFLSLIGGVAIGTGLRMPPGEPFRKIKFGVGFCILVLAIFGTIMLNFVRGLDAAWIEESLQSSVELSEDLDANPDPLTDSPSRQTKLAPFFTIASISMGVAGELGSAFAFDQFLILLTAVWTGARLQRKIRRLEADLIKNSYLVELIRGKLHVLHNQSKMRKQNRNLLPLHRLHLTRR